MLIRFLVRSEPIHFINIFMTWRNKNFQIIWILLFYLFNSSSIYGFLVWYLYAFAYKSLIFIFWKNFPYLKLSFYEDVSILLCLAYGFLPCIHMCVYYKCLVNLYVRRKYKIPYDCSRRGWELNAGSFDSPYCRWGYNPVP